METPYAIAPDVSAGTRGASALVLPCGRRAAAPGSNVNMDSAETDEDLMGALGGTRTPNLLIRRDLHDLVPPGQRGADLPK